MNKYEFYSKLLQEDFPVKYRQDFAEHDSEQCKKIQDLKAQLEKTENLLKRTWMHLVHGQGGNSELLDDIDSFLYPIYTENSEQQEAQGDEKS